jgi:hypothetical protein
MRTLPAVPWTRRAFLGGLTLAATIGCLGPRPMPISAAPPPETTRIRLVHDPSICVTPQYLAEELLRADGFSEVQYVEATDGFGTRVIAAGGADMMMEFAGVYLTQIDAGAAESGRSASSRTSRWPCSGRDRPSTCFCPAWRPTWASIRAEISAGSRILPRSRCACSAKARSMPSRGSRRSRRSCAPGGLATWCSAGPALGACRAAVCRRAS